MSRFCLDTSTLLTLRDNEPGADRVAQLLEAPVRCVAYFMTRMEVLYRVWKDEGERAGRLAYEQLQALPIDWLETTEPLLLSAAELKAGHRLSLADAWIAAAAPVRRHPVAQGPGISADRRPRSGVAGVSSACPFVTSSRQCTDR